MASVLEKRGILLIDFMKHGITNNADAYCETLKKLRQAIQNKTWLVIQWDDVSVRQYLTTYSMSNCSTFQKI